MRVWLGTILLLAARLMQAAPDPRVVAEVPVHFREGLLWVEVQTRQGTEPLHFLLDSGASASVISIQTARRLGLALGPKVSVLGVRAKLTGNWPVKFSAKAGEIQLPSAVLALDLGKLSAACSNSVDGLIGADFFSNRIVQIDYRAQKIRLLDHGMAPSGEQVIPLDSRRCGLRVPVSINDGNRQWLRLDTGCATAVQWVTTKTSAEQCTSKLAVGLAEVSIPQIVARVRLGGKQFEGIPTGLHRNALFPGEAGLVGNDLLSRFGVVTIDCSSGWVILGSASKSAN